MKRVLSVLLAVCLVCGLVPVTGLAAEQTVYEGMCGEDAYYELNTETGVLRIYGSGPMTDYYRDAPWNNYRDNIQTIVVEEGITSIGQDAFCGLDSATSVELPTTLRSIGREAFLGCKNMTVCDIPASVTFIGDNAFDGCTVLKRVDLPKGLTTLGSYAFWQCKAVTDVVIPGSLNTIGRSAFSGCSSLENLTIQEGVENIEQHAFTSTAVRRVVIPASAKTIGDWALSGCQNLEYAVFMPGCGITYLRQGVFSDDSALKRVRLPDDLEEIGVYAFSGCESLTRLDLPSTMKKVSGCTFQCTSLRVITVASADMSINTHDDFGTPNQTTLYGYNPSTTREFAVQNGHMFRELGTEPEDDWDPFAEPTPTPTPTPSPTPSPSPSPDTPTPTPDVPTGTPIPTPGTPTPEPADRFRDVSKTHYARKAINWAVANKVAGGMSTNVFGVGKNCDRSQAVFFIWAAEGRPEPSLTQNPFVDVNSGAYYYKAVLWAKENGVTSGKSATTFDPTGNVTRGQIMTFLYAAKGKPAVSGSKNFSDVKPSDYFSKAVAWAAENGVSSGKGSGTFKPKDNCKREEIVTFLYQAYN